VKAQTTKKPSAQRGFGLVELMVSTVLGMLVVLVFFQVFQLNEGQKRTTTAGNDAQESASYGIFLLGRDLSIGGNGIASSATALDGCALLRPGPAVITAGATDNAPDAVTVFFGGSGSLSTPVALLGNATIPTSPNTYQVGSPVGFSPNDVVAAVQGTTCTLSTVNAGGIAVAPATGIATITHTPIAGNVATTYSAVLASLVNLGQAASLGRIVYSVDPTHSTLQRQDLLAANGFANGPVSPVVSDVVNLKAQFGLDTDNDGAVDTWQAATGPWSSANLPVQPLAKLQQIRAVRVAVVARSVQYEKDPITPGPLLMFDGAVSMTLTADQQHYRYKILETIVPLRNAVWNAS
jgi:type IV pilus assembly protein PilW